MGDPPVEEGPIVVLDSGVTSLDLCRVPNNFISLNKPLKCLPSREVQVSEVGPLRRPGSIGAIGAVGVRRGGSALINVSQSHLGAGT